VDVRLVAATHRDLGRQVQEQKFREDLYYRLSTIPLVVPPLRERGSDVVLLARRLVERIAVEMGRPGARLSGSAEQELVSRSWPGNVRQLRNVLERALLLTDHSTLGPADVTDAGAATVPSAGTGAGSRLTLAEAERRHIEAVLREERGAVASAAEVLGLSRSALYERIKKHGIVTAKGADN
jgi:DNA-binding NtrC family response regulator